MQSILITGVTGFVGKTLAEKAVTEGLTVLGAIRSAKDMAVLQTGVKPIQIQSIGADTDWSLALEGVEVIIHLAARVHEMNDTASDPLTAFREVNVAGTERLARMAAQAGVRRFVYLSSIKVNGEGCNISYTELDKPAPQDAYSVSKWEAEQVLQKIAAQTGLEFVIIRPPLVYGPGVKANFLKMVEVVNRGIPLPFTNINNSRSLIYLGNLIDAIITCISHPEAAGQTYLVSDGEDISTPELFRMVACALGKPARLFHFPPRLMRLAGRLTGKSEAVGRLLGSLVVDSSKIRNELGWKPPYTMEQGLRETAEWFKRQC